MSSSAADLIRERHLAARRTLKGDNAAAPNSTVQAATLNVTSSSSSSAANDGIDGSSDGAVQGSSATNDEASKVITEWLKNSKDPMPWSPLRRLDLVILGVILFGLYYYILHVHK